METILFAFSVALQPVNLLYAFGGVVIGTLVGVLPGIGPSAAISLLLPTTFRGDVVPSLIMLAGIFYGTQYGGSTTSILVNIPGEAASVVTCLDGYKMAQKGRAGPALGMAALGSFIAGTFSVVLLTLVAPPLSEIGFHFGSPEFAGMAILGLTLMISLSSGSLVKALMMAVVGLILGTVGMDLSTGSVRFTFGIYELEDGIGLAPVAMGLFGIGEVLVNIEESLKEERKLLVKKVKGLLPNLQDWKDSYVAIIQGSFVGFLIGLIPGGNAIIASIVSYALQKRISKHPEKLGTGAIEGVAAPESANNAATGSAFIPLLTFGIPTSPVMALLLAGFLVHGVIPGPLLIKNRPDLFWGLIFSMYVGNIMLLILNLPLIRVWVKVLDIPYSVLFPLILLFCLVGAYTLNNSLVEVGIVVFFGFIGFLMRKFAYEPALLILALVMGPMLEESLRRSLDLSGGTMAIFLHRPIALGLLIVSVLLLLSFMIFPVVRKQAEKGGDT
ncbi:MAG: transporter [Deltaproteobacteria bacterium RBG_16_48_10]|nr:MAG: transporter [Deltaproteobacteria bacterium RBG_16_48_10]